MRPRNEGAAEHERRQRRGQGQRTEQQVVLRPVRRSERRVEQALQHKLNAVADGLADLMEHFAEDDPGLQAAKEDLAGDIEDLRAAVGLEGEM